jgi:methanogenic corrinoid protein MtbC1
VTAPRPAAEAYRSYQAAVLDGSRRRAADAVDAAVASGLDLRTIYLDVLQPTLREVGRLWQFNEITVADEHLATAITQMVMARLYAEFASTAATGGPTLIGACAETERHEIGLRMLCDLVEVEGWDAVYLGSTVPIESLVDMVRQRRPDAVALSASIAPHLPQIRSAIDAIRGLADLRWRPLILVGGRPFLDDRELSVRLGADLTAEDAAEAVELLGERVR